MFRYAIAESPSGVGVIAPPGYTLVSNGDGTWNAAPGGGSIPLPIPVSDLDAIGVPTGYVLQVVGGVAVWGPIPTAFDITAFNSGVGLLQAGQTVVNPSFTAAYNHVATIVSLTDTQGHNDPIALPGTAFVSPHSFLKSVSGQSETFTLHANDGGGSDTAQRTLFWGELVYWGEVPDTGTYNAAFIQSLDQTVLKLGAGGNYGFNASPPDSCFFCALASYGLTAANFFVGVFPFACSKVAANVPLTNAQGVAQTYDVFRSDNIGLGSFTLSVQ